jgi:hypothetical protein
VLFITVGFSVFTFAKVYIREEIIEVCDYANVVPHRAQLKKWSDGFPGLNGMSSTDKTTSGQASSVDHALTEIFPRENSSEMQQPRRLQLRFSRFGKSLSE